MTSSERHKQRYERRIEKRNKRLQQYTIDKLSNADNLYKAWLQCRKGVMWKESTQRFDARSVYNISELKKKIEKGENITRGFVEFDLSERGKKRHIKSVHISERVVQKCFCNEILNPLFEPSLIYDNGASQKYKGTSFTRKRLHRHLCEYYRKHGNKGYILTIDYKHYFDTVDHKALYKLADKKFFDPKVCSLFHQLIDAFGNTGLGLGSQVSQIAAVYLPVEIDHYIKQVLHCHWYGRYMDDSYIISDDRKHLEQIRETLQDICQKYGITISMKKTHISRLDKQFVFLKCKYTLSPTGKIIKRPYGEALRRAARKLKTIARLQSEGKANAEDLRSSIASVRGYLKYFNAHRQYIKLAKLYSRLVLEV